MPSTIAPSMKAIIAVRTTSSVSMPAPCMPATSSKLNPSRRSITSTRRVTRVGCGRGTTYRSCSRSCSIAATSSMLAASMRKSSSSTIVSANSSTSAGGLARAATGMRPTRWGASHAITRRSLRTSDATAGRCTLTTTCSPVRSRAAWTWAIDAAASGCSSKNSKMSSSRAPRSCSTVSRTASKGSAGTWSRHFLNSLDQLGGEEPFARGDDLAELDVGRAEFLGGKAQPAGDVGAARRWIVTEPLPALLDQPRDDRTTEVADDGQHPRPRRNAGRSGEDGDLGPRLRPEGCRELEPPDVFSVDLPGRVLGERGPAGVRRIRHHARMSENWAFRCLVRGDFPDVRS